MELFQKFFNQVKRGYGQVDKNVFGGLLPAGAATPIGAAYKGAVIPKEFRSMFKPMPESTRRFASVLDAVAGGIAKAQPFVENTIKATPEPIQNTFASGLNNLPFSVNLFSRYYTGLGNKNLQVPESVTTGIKEKLNTAPQRRENAIIKMKEDLENATQLLGTFKAKGNTEATQELNDAVAEIKSNLNRVEQGHIPFSTYGTKNTNPLTSPGTSLGSVWFEPKDKGYIAKEKYDFMYGNKDAKDSVKPPSNTHMFSDPGTDLTFSQATMVQAAAMGEDLLKKTIAKVKLAGMADDKTKPTDMISPYLSQQGKQKLNTIFKDEMPPANMNPLTNIGRGIVSKMPENNFEYLINIR